MSVFKALKGHGELYSKSRYDFVEIEIEMMTDSKDLNLYYLSSFLSQQSS